jgi:inorganic triphosphatase YgiF
MELEYKLAVSDPALLEKILFDPQIAEVRQGGYRLLHMGTVYYDTADRRLRDRPWTLRLRQENEILVATLKTPGDGRARGEWECRANTIDQAIPLLLEAGAPAELPEILADQRLIPLCAAQFTRRAADVAFADGTVCEFCGDVGMLIGGMKEESLCEVEVELKSGNAETAEAFAAELMDRFNLSEEPRSKFARAAALADR